MTKRIHFIDFETHCFGPHNMSPPIVCMSWQSSGEEAKLELWEDARLILKTMLREAANGQAVVVGHRVSYDMACVIAHDHELAPLVWMAYAADGVECTRIREKLLDIAGGGLMQSSGKNNAPYSLDQMCQRKFGKALDKGGDGWRLRYQELENIPVEDWPQRAIDYAVGDSAWGFKIYQEQAERMVRIRHDIPTQHLDSRASLALQLMSSWGVTTDQPRARALQVSIQKRMEYLEFDLITAGFMMLKEPTLNLFDDIKSPTKKSSKAIRQAVQDTWPTDLGPVPTTDKGAIKAGKDTIEFCRHPALKSLVEYNTLQKQGSTYVEALLQGVIHPNYNELVNSGRTSCRAINIQNQPRLPGVRECFVAREGKVLVACDFDSQEMRTLAQAQLIISGHSKLAERYQKNIKYDPHQDFADSTNMSRQATKILNFGVPGGMGPKGLVRYAKGYKQDWSVEFATDVKNKYFIQWPEMNDFFAFIQSVVGPASCGNLTIPQSGMMCGAVGYCEASNRMFQTPAAHASKDALFQVVRRCFDGSMNSHLIGSKPWAFIHDEVIVETFDCAVDEVTKELEVVMTAAMQPWVPDVPCSAQSTAMVRWSKQAEHTVKDGRIIPWDEERSVM